LSAPSHRRAGAAVGQPPNRAGPPTPPTPRWATTPGAGTPGPAAGWAAAAASGARLMISIIAPHPSTHSCPRICSARPCKSASQLLNVILILVASSADQMCDGENIPIDEPQYYVHTPKRLSIKSSLLTTFFLCRFKYSAWVVFPTPHTQDPVRH
jgi:hypothetical protein